MQHLPVIRDFKRLVLETKSPLASDSPNHLNPKSTRFFRDLDVTGVIDEYRLIHIGGPIPRFSGIDSEKYRTSFYPAID